MFEIVLSVGISLSNRRDEYGRSKGRRQTVQKEGMEELKETAKGEPIFKRNCRLSAMSNEWRKVHSYFPFFLFLSEFSPCFSRPSAIRVSVIVCTFDPNVLHFFLHRLVDLKTLE